MTEEHTEQAPEIARVTDPWGIFKDIVFRPKRFFEHATEEHLLEGAKVGVISGILGFFLGVLTNVGLNYIASSAEGSPLDESAVWGLPFALGAIVFLLFVEFFTSIGVARLLRGKGGLRREILAFDCSLAPTVLWAVPFLGVIVAPAWQVVIYGRGLAAVEEFATARAYAAALMGILATVLAFAAVMIVLAIVYGM
jgi:hypothetical protein